MALYTISDLHLPLGIDKPMDIFGASWDNYVERLQENWQNTVNEEDTVVMPGDFSWAMYIGQSKKDFEFIEKLNGKKILLKGNHDYWWETYNKMSKFLSENNYSTISILHNNSFMYNKTALCGNRGWIYSQTMNAEDKQIYDREIGRLRLSIESGLKEEPEHIYVFTHYPPLTNSDIQTPLTEVLKEYGVEKCFYGHLHANSHKTAVQGVIDGIEYKLVSSDYLGFMPYKITEE